MCTPGKSRSLSEVAAAEAAAGPLSFARFVELALYHPDLGYYASGRARVGRQGDFYTNVSVGAAFGRILAAQFREMAQALGEPLVVVEQGAHDGALAADVLEALDGAARYHIVEPFPALRARQQAALARFAPAVEWHADVAALPEFSGVHFSNELVDALPFHLVRSTGAGWEEMFVAWDGEWHFVGGPASEPVRELAAGLPARPAGFVTELRPAAADWIAAVAGRLRRGFVLVADYGHTRDELLAPHRRDGTFSCYHAHRRDAAPFADIGGKDITAHVDFTTLMAAGHQAGLDVAGFTDQHHFVIGAAESTLRSLENARDAAAQKFFRAMQTLAHPESMGRQFHYLCFAKAVSAPLAGFRYA